MTCTCLEKLPIRKACPLIPARNCDPSTVTSTVWLTSWWHLMLPHDGSCRRATLLYTREEAQGVQAQHVQFRLCITRQLDCKECCTRLLITIAPSVGPSVPGLPMLCQAPPLQYEVSANVKFESTTCRAPRTSTSENRRGITGAERALESVGQ